MNKDIILKREDYLKRIKPFIDKDLIKVITGIRRSGKSVLLMQIQEELINQGVFQDNLIYYNFEDFKIRHLLNIENLYQDIEERTKNLKGKKYLFFDEIQEVPEWEKVINSLRLDSDFDIYITGSNAKLLSSDLSTKLSGRYVEIPIFPLTFSEFKELYSKTKQYENNEEVFNKFLSLGGMPYLSVLDFDQENSNQYLKDLYNSVFIKDILKRNNFRDVDLLERIIYFLIDNNGQSFSANSISKYFKSENRNISVNSILNYLKACEDAFLIKRLKKEKLRGKKSLKSNEKIYLADHGFHNSLLGPEDINQTLENIVLNELIKRGYKVTIGDVNGKEIDFIATKRGNKIYIQVCYLLADENTIDREFDSLRLIKDNYPKFVLSLDKYDFSREGIIHRNIIDFLLDKSW